MSIWRGFCLIDRGANVHNRDEWGGTPLMSAAYKCPGSIVQLLIDKGSDVNARDRHGQNALIQAVSSNNIDAARVLLKAGSRVDLADRRSRSMPIPTRMLGNHEMTKLLRQH